MQSHSTVACNIFKPEYVDTGLFQSRRAAVLRNMLYQLKCSASGEFNDLVRRRSTFVHCLPLILKIFHWLLLGFQLKVRWYTVVGKDEREGLE